jgi:pantetheine-phosphate adenylyltransferase/dephospho-CoA kinase
MKVAVIGGIGSGKSTIVKLLADQLSGLFTICSVDQIVADTYKDLEHNLGPCRWSDLCELVGTTKLTKQLVSDFAFSSDENRKKVEQLITPCISAKLESIMLSNENVLIEFPTLVEHGKPEMFDEIINVAASERVRIQRVKERSGWSEEKIRAVINAQASEAERAKIATTTILNEYEGLECLDLYAIAIANDLKQKELKALPSSKKVGIVAGSFDPITYGHTWMIMKAAETMDRVVVLIASNPKKKSFFESHKKYQMILKAIGELPLYMRSRVSVDSLPADKLVVSYAKENGFNFIVRGIRNIIDMQYEQELNLIQRKIAPEVNILYFITPRELTEVSSSMVKSMIHLQGWEKIVQDYVPSSVLEELRNHEAK